MLLVLLMNLQDLPLATHPTGLPMTALPLIDAGLLFDDEGQSIRAPNGLTRTVSIGDLVSVGDSAGPSISEEPSAGALQANFAASKLCCEETLLQGNSAARILEVVKGAGIKV